MTIMNVWVFNHYATPPDAAGVTRHYDLAKEIQKTGQYTFSIFAAGFNHRTRKEERLKKGEIFKEEVIAGVKFIWIRTTPYFGGNDWRRAINMLSYFFVVLPISILMKEKPDIIIASSPHLLAGLAGYLLACVKRAKFIFEVRDLWPQTFVDIGGYSKNNPFVVVLRGLEKYLYIKSYKIIVLLPKAADYISNLGVSPEKVVYIPNGVDPGLLIIADTELPTALTNALITIRARGRFVIGYIGNHGVANDFATVIDVAKQFHNNKLDDIQFLFVGDGPLKKKLIDQVEKNNLLNVTFFPTIPKKQIPGLLNKIDVGIIPMKKTGLYKYGISFLKMYDYMLCGKPVIIGVNSINNPISDANCGITIEPECKDALTGAIMYLYNLPSAELKEMGERGYPYVMLNHSITVLSSRLVSAMQNR